MKYGKLYQLLERKDHLIKRIATLTDEQKSKAIEFFANHPNYENEIDWNRKDLDWEDFESVINKVRISKSQIPNFVKEDEHYVVLYSGDGVKVYQPLTYIGARYLASTDVAPHNVEGKWCIAYQKERDYWDNYSFGSTDEDFYPYREYQTAFLFICTNETKTAVEIIDYPGDIQDGTPFEEITERVEEALKKKAQYLYDKLGEENKEGFDEYFENFKATSIDYTEYLYFRYGLDQMGFWDSNDEPYNSSEEKAYYFREHLRKYLTIEQLYNLCKDALGNLWWVEDAHDEDLAIGEELDRLSIEAQKSEFLAEYKKCKKEGKPFVYEGDINRDTLRNLGLGDYDEARKGWDGFKIKIDKVDGSIFLTNLNLLSLKNFPNEVTGSVCIDYNPIESLEGSPIFVGGEFDASNTNLTSLKGSPERVSRMALRHIPTLKGVESLLDAPKHMDSLSIYDSRGIYEDFAKERGYTAEYLEQGGKLYTEFKTYLFDFLEKNGIKVNDYIAI